MKFSLILYYFLYFDYIYCLDSDSTEINKIEFSPFYDTVIISDIADIINDFENNVNIPFFEFISSNEESDENIEDLLSEYQHYLDKAYNQRKQYLEKSKTKNKVPLLRHDKYGKTSSATSNKYDDYYTLYNPNKFSQTFRNSLEMFLPVKSRLEYQGKSNVLKSQTKQNQKNVFNKMIYNEKNMREIPTSVHKSMYESDKKSCLCKKGQIPCECRCKQCLIALEPMVRNTDMSKITSQDANKNRFAQPIFNNLQPQADFFVENDLLGNPDNSLNILIKLNIQLPNKQDIGDSKNISYDKIDRLTDPKSVSTLKLPFSFFKFPMPMELIGFKKNAIFNHADSSSPHKISMHKRKKSKSGINNKNHRKNDITSHNIKLDPHSIQIPNEETYNIDDYNIKMNNTNPIIPNHTKQKEPTKMDTNVTTSFKNKTYDSLVKNETQNEKSVYAILNISNSSFNMTEEIQKIENSIETEYPKKTLNVTTEKIFILRQKRDILLSNVSKSSHNKQSQNNNSILEAKSAQYENNKTLEINSTKIFTKPDKSVLIEKELLYWPSSENSKSKSTIKQNNITSIILDREHKRAKINMTKDTIRHNRTIALVQAIFGEVDWEDVDIVAPAFMSFVGKYIRGALTFCSRSKCHSMKCADKICIHRICLPEERFNQKGHCGGSNYTDSTASMESIMDLPSNIAFEIVDILQDKMMGKLFGKVTLCISLKCVSFVAVKKKFLKSKCSIKELMFKHCPNLKDVKYI